MPVGEAVLVESSNANHAGQRAGISQISMIKAFDIKWLDKVVKALADRTSRESLMKKNVYGFDG